MSITTPTPSQSHAHEEMSRKKIQRLLTCASGELERWEGSVLRARGLISSLANLTEQQEACERCLSGGGLGALEGYTLAVPLLQARLSLAVEKCLAGLHGERKLMYEVVQRLKRFAKEGQNALKDAVAESGLEASAVRTAESFSLQDHTHWLDELHCGLRSLLEGISVAMETVQYTSEGVSKLRGAWQSDHRGLAGNLRYTVARFN